MTLHFCCCNIYQNAFDDIHNVAGYIQVDNLQQDLKAIHVEDVGVISKVDSICVWLDIHTYVSIVF